MQTRSADRSANGPSWRVRNRLPATFRRRGQDRTAERLKGAILDRLTHHVHSLEMNGESYRLRQSKIAKPQS